ncbi:hypothetical protein MTR67_000758 [Solanum verrucosum]|uniref:Histone deacetylase n=1 Tax=Solanum verrucosum TaxID=315347 RepID=A0AAF0T7R9_SOLVR|nr:hypothetical protein MTR67_000758 [Solanum verrucosum]
MNSVVSLPAMMSAAAAPPLANFTATTASRPTAPSIQCSLLFYVRHHVYSHKKYSKNGITIKYRDLLKHIRPEKGYSSTSVRGTIYCSNQKERDVGLPSDHIAVGAKVIYAAAPAMGHNQESHPECNSRVPAILTTLEKMKLTSKLVEGIDSLHLSICLRVEASRKVQSRAILALPWISVTGNGSKVLQAVAAQHPVDIKAKPACNIQCHPFRGSDVVEVQNFRPATTDDIGSVHAGPYISGLEKVA